MAAHLRDLPQYKCWCGKVATVELYNTWNAPTGRFCRTHGQRALKEFWRAHPDHAPARVAP